TGCPTRGSSASPRATMQLDVVGVVASESVDTASESVDTSTWYRTSVQTTPPPEECDVVVVGAGLLGLAAARELLPRPPDVRLTVIEREDGGARHQTAHNSGGVHGGNHYRPRCL